MPKENIVAITQSYSPQERKLFRTATNSTLSWLLKTEEHCLMQCAQIAELPDCRIPA